MLTARKMFSVSFTASAVSGLETGTVFGTKVAVERVGELGRVLAVAADHLGDRAGGEVGVAGILALRARRRGRSRGRS